MGKYLSYLNLSEKEWQKRLKKVWGFISPCKLCPRECGAKRKEGEKGFCKTGIKPFLSSFHPHFGEESCLVGKGGSGTIFFTFCNLSCVFCQNFEISQLGEGKEIEIEDLAKIMIYLQNIGCENINLVSPTHQLPQILSAIYLAQKKGLSLPIVWNSNAYEKIEVLKFLEGVVDIYLPDFKYGENKFAEKFSSAPRYFEIAKSAIKEMWRQVGELKLENEIAKRGLLVRHLVLPENLSFSEKVFSALAQISKKITLNVMDQYYPCWQALNFPSLSRKITSKEYQKALNLAQKYGLQIWR